MKFGAEAGRAAAAADEQLRTNTPRDLRAFTALLRKHVMTHARKNASIGQYRVEGQGHVERWSHGETVGGAWPVHSLREGKAKKDMAKKVKSSGRESQCLEKHSMKMNETKTKKGKCNTTSERHRKLYPLRGRSEAKSCHVLLTRLDDETKVCEVDPNRVSGHKKKPKPYKKADNSRESLQERLKTKPEATIDKPSAQEPRKRRLASLNAEALNSLLLEKTDGPPGAKLARKQGGGSSTTEQTKTGSKRAEKTCQKPKRMKKASTDKMHDALSLYAPTPRRLAGLNAAALLKLTSSTAANKHRIKTDRKTVCKPQAQKSGKHSWTQPELEGACEVCKSRSFESKPTPESHRLAEAGYQSMLGYRPVKLVKEEPVEAELSPYFCCPPEGSVGYCHRLALFLGRQAYGEGEEKPVVKHECLVPAHPALTLSAHPCLCVDPCCSSYYVHIAHPGTTSLSARMLPCTHSGSQLLASSGVPHPAFCGSVGSPCCGEACRVSGYAFSAVQSRTCSFSTNCSSCSHPIKTEEEHSRTLLVPPALPRSGCPGMPRVTPRLLSTTSEAEVRLKVGKECPQNTKPSNGSLTMGHSRSSLKHPTASAKHQKKASHRQATNGWRPVGVPTEKEVFIAGDDETVLRQSYEGVERNGEVIRVRDTVLVRSGPRKKSLPYVAKISALWEDPRTGELMMSLFWYYRPEHTQGGRDPSMHCENEIFASRHQDENSVACIEERCYVLPLAQYCRFCALVKRRSEGMSDHAPLVPRPSDSADHAPLVPRPSDSTGPAHRPVPRPSDSTGPAHRLVPHPSDSTGPAHRPVPRPSDGTGPAHHLVPDGIDPQLVYLCRHVYDFRYGRILKNLQ